MSGEEKFVVRPWTEADLEGVFQLIDRENWGWELAEIRRIHKLDPRSSVVAEMDGELRGLVTVVNYGLMAFIVHVIVKEGWRRTGVGNVMVKSALETLGVAGVSRVELHANPDVLGFYRQLGFHEADDIAFYSRDPSAEEAGSKGRIGAGGSVELLGMKEYGALSKLISTSMDVDAQDVARSLKADPPDVIAGVVESGRLKGALLGKVGVRLNGIGPWVMEEFDDDCAREMLRMVLSELPAKRTDVCIASANGCSRYVTESEGFHLVKGGMVRTVKSAGPTSSYPPGLFAVGHFGVV